MSWHRLCADAERLIGLKRYDDAARLVLQAIAAAPDHARPRCLLARIHFEQRRYRECIRAAQEAVHADPACEWAHRLWALALLRVGSKQEALTAAREAARLLPRGVETLHVLAECLSACGLFREAREAAGRLLAVAPDRALSHSTLGSVALRERNYAEAEQHYRRALTIEPESWLAMNNLGVALQRQGRKREAVEMYHNAARLDPSADLSRRNLVSATGSHASIGVLAIWAVLQGARVMVENAPVELHWPVFAGAALFLAGGAVALYRWRRARIAELPPAAVAYYRLEKRLRRRSEWAQGLLFIGTITTFVALLCWTGIAASSPAGMGGIRVPWNLLYGALWLGFAAQVVAAVRSTRGRQN